jgi:hypothetical protein
MKNIFVILLLAAAFFLASVCTYFVVFKIYFASAKLANKTERIVRMTFQRESRVGKIKFSPFGKFGIDSFEMANRGGFKNGGQFSVKSVNSKIALSKLFKRELYVDFLNIDGAELNLDYSSRKKFDYLSFFGNVKYLFMKKSAKHGLIRSVEITNILLSGGTLNLKLDAGKFIFSDIVLTSDYFDISGGFFGKASCGISFNKIRAAASFDFAYDKENSVIKINNFICSDYNIHADGKIILFDDGSVSLEYTAKINGGSYLELLAAVAGADFFAPMFVDDDIIISYPSADKKSAV